MDTLKLDSDSLKIVRFAFQPVGPSMDFFYDETSNILTNQMKEIILNGNFKKIWIGEIKAVSKTRKTYFIKSSVLMTITE